jgi:hypothetical protein
MGYIKEYKEYKDYKIYRSSWWKFWQVDCLEFNLPTRYENAYEEVEKKLINGSRLSMELSSWVIEDIREQLVTRVVIYGKLAKKAKKLSVKFHTRESGQLAKKAKKLSVKFHTRESGQYYTDGMDFYLRGEDIYFDIDNAIKREKLLSKLGI